MAFVPSSWSAGQLAQANGMSPGLADYMLSLNSGNPGANQQFYQAAGFTNPAGSQQMLNQSGRDWILNNNQTYGNINADAGQPNGANLRYGMMGSTPYSYSPGAVANDPAFQQWFQQVRSGLTPSGPAPAGVNVYSQFGSGAQPQQIGAANPGTPGMQAPGNPTANLPQTPNGTTQPQTLGQLASGVGGILGGILGGSSAASGNVGAGVPGGNMSIPAAPGNPYTLNIGNYLNPMMNYAMQQGDQSILNSQASAGLLNSGDTAKQLYGYGLGLGANNFNNAAGIAAGQQQFGAGLDQYDQQFAYNAQNADRNFALQSLLGEGQLGLGGATQQGWNDRYLAQLLSGNLGALGQAQGAGAIGGSNAINNAISQMIGSYLGGNALNTMGIPYGGGGST